MHLFDYVLGLHERHLENFDNGNFPCCNCYFFYKYCQCNHLQSTPTSDEILHFYLHTLSYGVLCAIELKKCGNIHNSVIASVQVFNATYKKNLMRLKNFVMVKFLNDTMVEPKETEVGRISSQLYLFR